MSESTRKEHVNGFYMVIVALIGLIGGYLLKDPVQKAFFKQYSQIGGVWKPHGDLMSHCSIATVKDTFYVRIEGFNNDNETWIIQSVGTSNDGKTGDFKGKMHIGNKQYSMTGHLELAGSDQLGIVIYINGDKNNFQNYAFIRESLEVKEIEEKETK